MKKKEVFALSPKNFRTIIVQVRQKETCFAKEETAMTLGLCMIVKDEAAVLGRCLDSAAGVFDEIIIVDTGSTDATKEIARRYTKDVFDFAWRQDFAAARNFSFAKATADYCMWLDADEVLLPKDAAALRALKETLSGAIGRYFLRTVIPAADGSCALTFERARIVRRGTALWQGRVHEDMIAGGKITHANISVTHLGKPKSDPFRNIRIFARAFADGEMPNARQTYYFARELADCGLYRTAIDVFAHFLHGEGWVEDQISACLALARCLHRTGRPNAAMRALLYSFSYAPPRAETCCALGDLCREAEKFADALFWYKLALNIGPTRGSGFADPNCGGYIPCMWLCVCCDRLGDKERACAWNERAGQYKPQDPNFLQNREYFARTLQNGG